MKIESLLKIQFFQFNGKKNEHSLLGGTEEKTKSPAGTLISQLLSRKNYSSRYKQNLSIKFCLC